MAMKDKAMSFAKKFKLTSHHAIERFGVLFGIFAVTGALVIGGSGVAAVKAGSDALAHTALYTPTFTTSKTDLDGDVDGIFTNENGNKVLVMMHFSDRAQISYNAADYEAFLLGSDKNLNMETVSTDGIRGSFHVFGSTGYVGVLLNAAEPFDRQILNLTIRSNAELVFDEDSDGSSEDEVAQDASFDMYDQWAVFFNPAAEEAQEIPALESERFDPARAYYDIVLKEQESEAREKLDSQLLAMRTDLAQIENYSADLQTTKVDGLFLQPPAVPASIANDRVVGESAAEAEDGESTLTLETDHVVAGGFDLNWRSGNVYDGYLDVLVPAGQSYVDYLAEKREEESPEDSGSVSDMQWILSDGSDLKRDYGSSDVTMRPLTNVMNNLSQAYQNYDKHKSEYQSTLMLELLSLDVSLRDVQSNGSINNDENVITVNY